MVQHANLLVFDHVQRTSDIQGDEGSTRTNTLESLLSVRIRPNILKCLCSKLICSHFCTVYSRRIWVLALRL